MQQTMLYPLIGYVIAEKIDGNITKILSTVAVAYGLSERLLTSK